MLLKRVKDQESEVNFKTLASALDKLLKGWFSRGKVVSMTLAIGNNNLQHGLGRVVTKIIPVMHTGAASSFYYAQHSSDPRNFIVVNSSAACTVNFYVD